MMLIGKSRDRRGKSLAVNDRHDFCSFSFMPVSNFLPTHARRNKHGVDIGLIEIISGLFARLVSQIAEDIPDNLRGAPFLKASVHGFVIGKGLGEHVPLRASFQNPDNGFENLSGGGWFRTRFGRGIRFFREVIANRIPLTVREQHGYILSQKSEFRHCEKSQFNLR